MMPLSLSLGSLFEAYVKKVMYTYDASGIAVAIVDREQPVRELFFGFRDQEQKRLIDQDTIFGLASVTKSFTCLAVLQLAQQGKVDLDAPVSRYIPAFQNAHREKPVLVRHLMSHAGSFWPVERKTVEPLARRMGLWNSGVDLAYSAAFSQAAVQEVCADLDAQQTPLGEPGEYLSYSNDSFGLLSDIIRTQGIEDTYADYMKKHVLQPLGMSRSGCGFLFPARDSNAAILYEKRDGKLLITRDYHDNAFVMMGGGAMKSTLRDMERYLQLFLRRGEPLLSPDSFRRMTAAYVSYRPSVGYGYGLSVGQLAGYPVYGHGGSLTGVVLCNTTGVPATSIAEAAMLWCLGKNPCPVEPKACEPWAQDLQRRACGRYVSAEGDTVEITMNSTDLEVLSSGKPRPYRFSEPGVLFLQSKMTWSDLTLFPNAQGEIFAVRYGGRMLSRV